MRVSTRFIFDDRANTLYGVAATTITLFAFAYAGRFGPILLLAVYAVWLGPLVISPAYFLQQWERTAPFLVLPFLTVLSVLWSDQPGITLRAAVQYSSTVLCALVAAKLISVPVLTLGGLVGSTFVLGYSFLNGEMVYEAADQSYGFAGAFGSKNQFGLYAALGLIFSIAVLAILRVSLLWRALALIVLLASVIGLAMAESATATITAITAICVLVFARLNFGIPPKSRVPFLLVCAVMLIGVIITIALIVGLERIFALYDRSPTMTGRTYLWEMGVQLASEAAPFGYGYHAFWTQGRPEAEMLWHEFYIEGRGGFHFHNTYVEAFVAMSYAGLAVTLTKLLALLILSIRVLRNHLFAGSAMICAAFALLFAMRSLVELEFFNAYSTSTFMVTYVLYSMWEQRLAERQVPMHRPPPDEQHAAPPTPHLLPIKRQVDPSRKPPPRASFRM